MKRIISAALALALVAGASMVGLAQTTNNNTRTPRINKRQRNQQRRIAEGIENGSLTPREAARLERQEAAIQAEKRADKADGVVTKQERRQLEKDLNKE